MRFRHRRQLVRQHGHRCLLLTTGGVFTVHQVTVFGRMRGKNDRHRRARCSIQVAVEAHSTHDHMQHVRVLPANKQAGWCQQSGDPTYLWQPYPWLLAHPQYVCDRTNVDDPGGHNNRKYVSLVHATTTSSRWMQNWVQLVQL